MMWAFRRNWPSGFSSYSTAEEVTQRIDASALTAIVTGATSGIGLETARVLALRGAHVALAALSAADGSDTKQKIVSEFPSAKVDVFQLDLSSLQSVRNFAAEFISSGLPLNILINNAGIFMAPFALSEDGIELQFATNYLGHFVLTNLLLDTMRKTARESKREGRIVNVSSEGHRVSYAEGIRFHALNDPTGYNRLFGYGQSKLALILHSKELARSLKNLGQEEGADITVNSLHPGLIMTNIFNLAPKTVGFIITRCIRWDLKNVQQGAATTCYVALHPQMKGVGGEYLADTNLAKPSEKALDTALARKLWDYSLHLINK